MKLYMAVMAVACFGFMQFANAGDNCVWPLPKDLSGKAEVQKCLDTYSDLMQNEEIKKAYASMDRASLNKLASFKLKGKCQFYRARYNARELAYPVNKFGYDTKDDGSKDTYNKLINSQALLSALNECRSNNPLAEGTKAAGKPAGQK